MITNADLPPTSERASLKPKLVVLADLGRLKAYRLESGSAIDRPSWRLVEDRQTEVTHHLREDVTDAAGRYRKEPAVVGALSDGEQHNLDLERRQRALKALAQNITELIHREQVDGCYLAADARINQPLLDAMDPAARAKIQKNVPANLSKLDLEELRERFCPEEKPYVKEPRQA